MKKSLIFGITITLIIFLLSFLLDFYLISAYFVVSGIFILLTIIFSGSAVSYVRTRMENDHESKEDRNWRYNTASSTFFIAIPNIIAVIICYYFN